MIRCFFLLIMLFPVIGVCQSNKIIWADSIKLSWADYKVKDTRNKRSAISYFGLKYEGKINEGKIEIKVYAQFLPEKSWAKSNASENLLQHEQTHFDIVELYSRKLRKMIYKTNLKPRNMDKKLAKLYYKVLKQKDKCQNLYDEETDYSRNKIEQKNWSQKILKQLQELEKYSSTIVIK